MIRHDSIGYDAFVEPEVFGRMPGVNRGEARLKLLAVATGVDPAADIIMMEDGKLRRGVADAIVGGAQGFKAEKVLGGSGQGMIRQIRDFPHLAQAHIGSPRNEARRQRPFIHRLLDVPSHDMFKGVHEPTVAMREGQHLTDVHLLEGVEERMIDRFTARGILQRPPALGIAGVELHGRILTRGNPLIHLG